MSVMDRRTTPASRRAAFMSRSGYLKWYFMIFLALMVVVYKQISIVMNEELSIFTIFPPMFLLFALQSLIAEALGVRLGENGISIPMHLVRNQPWLIFWRKTLRWDELERINSISGSKVRLITTETRIDIVLKN